MLYHNNYDEPGRFSRCWEIAESIHLTLFVQAPEMTLNDIWPQICVN